MMTKTLHLICLLLFCSCAASPPSALIGENGGSLLEVTPDVTEYVSYKVRPILAAYPQKDKLSSLLKVCETLIDPKTGIDVNRIEPGTYMLFDKLEKIKLGSFISFNLSPGQSSHLKDWRLKYMQNDPADLFFAPSAHEVIKSRAAFGCSHYARAFIAVVKSLGLIDHPKDLRYVVSCHSDDYNQALEKSDAKATINGHQFVMVRIDSKWIAINTSKCEWTAMPEGFSPDSVLPPGNVPVRFASYPEVTFLLRKIGKDYDDDCRDNSLTNLMNIYRSGTAKHADFKWEKFSGI